MASKASWL